MPKNYQKSTLILSENLFPVVGVGASAGGLDAFKQLVKAIPPNSGMAYILVQHLAPQHESILSEILQKSTNIPVLEIVNNITVKPDHVYIIPSNKLLVATDGVLQLFPRPEDEKTNTIDIFFNSLAEIHQEHAIGIVLSGTGSDGTVGLKTIKDLGGITIAQDEKSAAHVEMPKNAIEADVVDFVVSPGDIPALLKDLVRRSQIAAPDFNSSDELNEEDIFRQILALLRSRKGVDFTYYKQTTIRRRILRRKGLNKFERLKEYETYLFGNKQEQDALFKDILIPVTSFFRDSKAFTNLCEMVFPVLFKDRPESEPIRIWVAGCSSGEEAYSIAICLCEYLGDRAFQMRIQIFATDISEVMISKARGGFYQKKDMAGVSDARREQFFSKVDGGYHVHKIIREMCVFATQNFLKDPPFARLDLISCRNVLIYMEPYLQQKALTTFHYALKPTGLLFLGKSETVGQSSDQFQAFNHHEKVYQRRLGAGRYMTVTTERSETTMKLDNRMMSEPGKKDDFQKAADEALFSKYGPVGVVINEDFDILQFRGSTGAYLEAPPGKASHNILKMAKEGLSFELRNVLHKARSNNKPISKQGILVDKGKRRVDIEVIPLHNTIEVYFLVLFNDSVEPVLPYANPQNKTDESKQSDSLALALERVNSLEKELAQAREDMRTIMDNQEAANEELQSANEELLSGSEELQSLNEELETTKEEVQSTNEELTTLNQELFERNDQLNTARKYSEAIVGTIHEALIVLTKDFHIKSANKAFYAKFNTEEKNTEGKFFFEIAHGIWNISSLRDKLQKILPEQSHFENFELTINFPSIGTRHLELNARRIINEVSNEQLILLAIQDSSERKMIEQEQKIRSNKIANERRILHNQFMEAPGLLAILKGPNHIIELANPRWAKFIPDLEIIGQSIHKVFSADSGDQIFQTLDQVYETGISYTNRELQISFINKSGNTDQAYLDIMLQPTRGQNNEIDGVFVFAVDVTELVTARKHMEVQKTMFQNMIIQSPAFAATFIGPDHTYSLVNTAYQTLFGNRELVGKKLADAVPELLEQGFVEQLDLVYNTGEIFIANELSFFIAPSTGAKFQTQYFNYSLQPLYNEFGNIEGVLSFGYDVTQQILFNKQNEANLRAILESTHQISWTADPQGQINYYNNYFYQYTGLDTQQALTKSWESFIYSEQLAANDEVWMQSVNSGTDYSNEVLVKGNDETYHWHVGKAAPVRNDKGEIILWVGAFTDIHDQKLFAEELEREVTQRTRALEEANTSLKYSNENLQQFASIASHDLQEPLRKIKTFTSILNRRFIKHLPEEGKEYVQKIRTSADRMSQLIKEVLEYSKILHAANEFVETDLNKILKNIVGDLELLIADTGAKINYEDSLPVIDANPLQINQLFYNLLTNSLKFFQETLPPEVSIISRYLSDDEIENLSNLQKDTRYLEIIVSDNGIGFEQQFANQIFQIFERLHSTDEFEGTGIGLALCKKIVENHHGLIYAVSEENKGAQFHVILPVTQS